MSRIGPEGLRIAFLAGFLSLQAVETAGTPLVTIAQAQSTATHSTLRSSAGASSVYGQPVSFTALWRDSSDQPVHVAGDLASLTHAVSSGTATPIPGCTAVPVNAHGVAVCDAIATLSVGVHSITAAYVGTGAPDSTSVNSTLTVGKTDTTTTAAADVSGSCVAVALGGNGCVAFASFRASVKADAPSLAAVTSGAIVIEDVTGAILCQINLGDGPSGSCTPSGTTISGKSGSARARYLGSDSFNPSPPGVQVNWIYPVMDQITVSSSPPVTAPSQAANFRATVQGSVAAAGYVTLQDTIGGASTDLCRDVEVTFGAAVCSYAFTSTGPHKIYAYFSIRRGGSPAFSATYTHLVAGSDVTLASSPNPAGLGEAILFTAVVGGSVGKPTGIVRLLEDGEDIGCDVSLVPASNGRASCALTLSAGSHTVIVNHTPDQLSTGSYKTSESEPITQVVGVSDATSPAPSTVPTLDTTAPEPANQDVDAPSSDEAPLAGSD